MDKRNIYPLVYALQNGADLDYGNVRAKMFDAKCPDECRVCIHNTHLTVMENGEHWFHTDEQLAFLDVWMKKAIG